MSFHFFPFVAFSISQNKVCAFRPDICLQPVSICVGVDWGICLPQHRYGLQVSYHLCQLSTTYGMARAGWGEGGVWNGANYRQLLPPEAGGLLYLSFRPVWCIHLHTCPPSCHPEHICAGGMCTARVPRMDRRLFRGCFVAQDERRQRWNNLTKCIKKAKLLIKLCQEGWTWRRSDPTNLEVRNLTNIFSTLWQRLAGFSFFFWEKNRNFLLPFTKLVPIGRSCLIWGSKFRFWCWYFPRMAGTCKFLICFTNLLFEKPSKVFPPFCPVPPTFSRPFLERSPFPSSAFYFSNYCGHSFPRPLGSE